MDVPRSFKFDVRIRSRLLSKGQVTEAEVAKHLEALPDLEAHSDVVNMAQPAIGTPAERPRPIPQVVHVPRPLARPVAPPVSVDDTWDDEDDDDDEEDLVPKKAPAAAAPPRVVAPPEPEPEQADLAEKEEKTEEKVESDDEDDVDDESADPGEDE